MVYPLKIEQLKKVIHQQLKEKDIPSRIQEVLTTRYGSQLKQVKDEELLEILEDGILDDMLSSLHFGKQSVTKEKENVTKLSHQIQTVQEQKASQEGCCLELHIGSSRAFLEHLLEPEPLHGAPITTLKLHVYFFNQKFISKAVPAKCEPHFSELFKFHLHRSHDPAFLLAQSEPIHIVLIKTDPQGETTLVSSCCLEWRNVLTTSGCQLSVLLELYGIGVERKVPVGLLDIKLKIVPPLNYLPKDTLSTQLSLEKKKIAEKERIFLAYSKLWWKEFMEIREEHAQRLVKIFTLDENMHSKPVTSWVQPVKMGLTIRTPREAAWFVSLLNLQCGSHLGSTTLQDLWHSYFTVCSLKGGTCEDHAVLLCCLFLGFNLDAYVCVGTDRAGIAYSWVLTFGRENEVIFWDCLTAGRYVHQNESNSSSSVVPLHPFKTVDCIFNHKCFFANCQPDNRIASCRFDLRDSSKWKAMSEDALLLMPKNVLYSPSFNSSGVKETTESQDFQQQVQALVAEYRSDHGLTTFWDEDLCHILIPALALYEIRGKSGLCGGDEEFLAAVHAKIPKGHSFKALPVHFLHKHSRKAFLESLKLPLGKEIITCHGDQVRLAVHAQVYFYPEDVVSVWIMYAVRYQQIL